MKRKEMLIIAVIFFIIGSFFYKTILFRQIPFPGDLLVNLAPYKSQSYLGFAPGGYPNIAQGVDVITEMYPWKYFTIQELKAGKIPFWNPHNFSGNFHLQNYQTAVFYPFNIVFFLFSFETAWTIYIILQPFLAMLFMYLFIRSLSLGRVIALIGAIAFAFSSYMTVWIEYGNISSTMLWLPLILFSLKRFIQKPHIFYFLLIVITLTCSFLAGYIQGIFYIYVLSIAYVMFELRRLKTHTFSFHFPLVLMFVLPILLTAFQLLPTYDLFKTSTRSPYSLSQIENLLQPLYYWATIFAPDFFGHPAHRNFFLPITYIERVMYFGIPLTFFSLLGIAKVKSNEMKFFFIFGLISLFLTTNAPLIKYLYLIPIPTISTTVPTRILSIFIFCMIIVGCYGVDFWIEQKKNEKTFIPIFFLGVYFFLWISVLLFPKLYQGVATHRSITIHNLVIPTVIACLTVAFFYLKKLDNFRFISIAGFFILVTADLFLFFQKITPFSPKELIYPQTPVMSYIKNNAGINRFWGYGSGYILPNFQTYDGTYSPEGNDALHLKNYGILLASSSNGNYLSLLPRMDANIAPGYGLTDMRNPYRQKILNLLGVKYVLNEDENLGNTLQPRYNIFPQEIYHLVWQQKPWQVYENKQVLPRFFLTNEYIIASNTKDALAKIYTVNLSKTLILPKQPIQKIDTYATGSISISNYSPDTVTFRTKTNGNMLLFLSDNYYHSWSARVDDNITPVYEADFTFRSIEVPKGKHTITFFNLPYSFSIGTDITLVGFIFLVFYSFYFHQHAK